MAVLAGCARQNAAVLRKQFQFLTAALTMGKFGLPVREMEKEEMTRSGETTLSTDDASLDRQIQTSEALLSGQATHFNSCTI